MAKLGANANSPAKTSPRNMVLLLWICSSQYSCRCAAVVSEVLRTWGGFRRAPLPWRRRTRRLPLKVNRDALPLRITVEHSLERVLAAHAALLVAAVRLPRELAETLVDLHPAGLDRVRVVDGFADVARPHVRRQTVVAVVRHRS